MRRKPLQAKITEILIEQGLEPFKPLSRFLSKEMRTKLDDDETRSIRQILASEEFQKATHLLLNLQKVESSSQRPQQ